MNGKQCMNRGYCAIGSFSHLKNKGIGGRATLCPTKSKSKSSGQKSPPYPHVLQQLLGSGIFDQRLTEVVQGEDLGTFWESGSFAWFSRFVFADGKRVNAVTSKRVGYELNKTFHCGLHFPPQPAKTTPSGAPVLPYRLKPLNLGRFF